MSGESRGVRSTQITTPPPNQSTNRQSDLHLKPLPYTSNENSFDLRAFLLDLIRSISHHPSTVTVDEISLTHIRRLSICVDEEDYGLLALDGRTFQALQTIVKTLSRRENVLATFEIVNRKTLSHSS